MLQKDKLENDRERHERWLLTSTWVHIGRSIYTQREKDRDRDGQRHIHRETETHLQSTERQRQPQKDRDTENRETQRQRGEIDTTGDEDTEEVASLLINTGAQTCALLQSWTVSTA